MELAGSAYVDFGWSRMDSYMLTVIRKRDRISLMELSPIKHMTQRHTKQRQHILRAIKASTRPVTADAVRSVAGCAKTTLYRNLGWLVTRCEIAVVDSDDGVKRYVGHSHHEATFTCQRCGKTRRLTSRALHDYVQRKMFGPQTVMTSRLSASGLCTDCTKQLKRL